MGASSTMLPIACAVALGLGGCLSGQTGSPDCEGAMSCVCDPLYAAGTLVRVRAERLESGQLEAVVQEVFESPGAAFSQLVQGDRIGGSVGAERPCASNASPGIEVGGDQLVLYRPGTAGNYPNCSALPACELAECSGLEEPALTECWTSCETSTEQTCADLRNAALLDGYYNWVVAWQEPLDFGDSHQLATSELGVLSSVEACRDHFPTPAPPSCHDTETVMTCAAFTSPRSDSSRAASWPPLLAGLALVILVRRGLPTRGTPRRPPRR